MKTHYRVERMIPDYDERSVFGGPALKRKFVALCGSTAYITTTVIDDVTCKACAKKILPKSKQAK